MKKKIFILEPSLNGHGGNFTKLLSQALSKNQEVSIAIYFNEFNNFFIQKYIDFLSIKHIYFLTSLMQKIKLPNTVEKFIFLFYIIFKFHPDIILLPSIDGMIYLMPFFKPLIWLSGKNIKIYGFLASYKYYYTQIFFLKKFLFKIGIDCFDKVLINDEFFAEHLKVSGFNTVQYMPDPVEYFHLNIDKKQLKLNWNFPIDGYLVGMTGSIDTRKGADIIIHASMAIKRKDITFILAGKVSAEIKYLLQICNISANLIIIDKFLSLEEMHEIITCFDLSLLPYRNSHFGIASMLMRTMACSRPALVSKYGWLEKMSAKFDTIYSFEDEQDFFNQIQNIENIIFNKNNVSIEAHYGKNSIEGFINSWTDTMNY